MFFNFLDDIACHHCTTNAVLSMPLRMKLPLHCSAAFPHCSCWYSHCLMSSPDCGFYFYKYLLMTSFAQNAAATVMWHCCCHPCYWMALCHCCCQLIDAPPFLLLQSLFCCSIHCVAACLPKSQQSPNILTISWWLFLRFCNLAFWY